MAGRARHPLQIPPAAPKLIRQVPQNPGARLAETSDAATNFPRCGASHPGFRGAWLARSGGDATRTPQPIGGQRPRPLKTLQVLELTALTILGWHLLFLPSRSCSLPMQKGSGTQRGKEKGGTRRARTANLRVQPTLSHSTPSRCAPGAAVTWFQAQLGVLSSSWVEG